ncbi:MAG: hypothetical protein M3070_01935 [Actinomycetota bacterium]|nr:hypothetical protein [Actinomycetota bacterium]
MQLSEIADRLYALPPDEFTKARDSAAREAREEGDRELADEVKTLRRPPVSAWAVNALARERSEPLDELLGLGAQLREAQQALAGDDLRALSRDRHRVIASLSDEARELAVAGGLKLADAAAREVSATLEAALADEAAAAAVRSGRLMRPLTSTGLEPVELMGAVAAPGDVAALPKRPVRPPKKQGERRATKARVAEARKNSRAARSDATRAERELVGAEQEATAAREAVAYAEGRIVELTRALKQAKADQSAADSERRRAERERDVAAKAHDAAQRAADKAEAAATRLEK